MVWLVNNGVQGIGTEDSPLALYEDADGDRGILADQVCAAVCQPGSIVITNKACAAADSTAHPSCRTLQQGLCWCGCRCGWLSQT
jgi:hypothetical protein